MNIEIIKVEIKDLLQLQKIATQTFIETFSEVNTEENMRKYLEENLSLDKISTELKNKDSEFYFAIINTDIIGYLKINFGNSQTELKHDNTVEIERIYVLKEYHGKKVANVLFEKALSISKHKQANYIWLGVWEENPRAITFYRKQGFVGFDKHIFVLGDDKQTDILMKLVL